MPEITDRDVLARAARVVHRAFVGAMPTLDQQGEPITRYMAAAAVGETLHHLYTLTGRATRKLDHLRHHHEVCWLFALPDYEEVVTLRGRAWALDQPVVAQHVWDRLSEAARAYAMNVLSNREQVEFVVIESQIDRVEWLCPGEGVVMPRLLTLEHLDT